MKACADTFVQFIVIIILQVYIYIYNYTRWDFLKELKRLYDKMQDFLKSGKLATQITS